VGRDGPLLGALSDVRFELQHVMLRPQDRLVCFTNGLSEARCGDSALKAEGIMRILRESERRDARGLTQHLYEGAVRFTSGAFNDDVAILVLGTTR
jgi:serine phosphatase RsbU (regulator of sigma subunit)